MKRAHILRIGDHGLGKPQPQQQIVNKRHARALVSNGLPCALFVFACGNRLSEVMRKACQHKLERITHPAADFCRSAEHQHRMLKRIPLGVITGILRHAVKRSQLMKPWLKRISIPQHAEEHIRAVRLQQRLLRLIQHARSGQAVKRHVLHPLNRLCIRRQVKPCGKLRPTQNAQRILLKMRARHRAEHAVLKILHAAIGVDVFPRQRIAHDRIDRKIPSRRRLVGRKLRIDLHGKIPVTRARSLFPPRQGNVDPHAFDREDAILLSAGVNFAELAQKRQQRIALNAVYLAVDIVAGNSQQPIAHASAHQQRLPAESIHTPRNFRDQLFTLHGSILIQAFQLALIPARIGAGQHIAHRVMRLLFSARQPRRKALSVLVNLRHRQVGFFHLPIRHQHGADFLLPLQRVFEKTADHRSTS